MKEKVWIFVSIGLVIILSVAVLLVIRRSSKKSGFVHERNDRALHAHGCSCSKGDACMCTNPGYFDLVCQQGRAREIFLEGLLVDARCYAISHENWTNDHLIPPGKDKWIKGCATGCAKSGVPVALLTGPVPPGPSGSNRAYILLHPSPNLAPHMEKRARVTGCLMRDMQAIFTTKVEVEEEGNWKNVEFTTPMLGMYEKKQLANRESFEMIDQYKPNTKN